MTPGSPLREPTPIRGALPYLLSCLVVLFAATNWCAHGGLREPAFDVDTFDYAQMARQVYRGEGFTMLQTFPYVQRYLVERGSAPHPPWPNTTRFPLIAVQEAAVFAVVGPSDLGILLTGGAMFVATALAVFLLGDRLHGPAAGILAALAVATEAEQLRFSRTGLLETGAGFFVVMVALALVWTKGGERRSNLSGWMLGVLLGLAFLQRYDLLALTPAAMAVAWYGSDAPRRTWALCAAGFAAAAGPWIARNLLVVGTVLGSTSVHRNLLGGLLPGDVYMQPVAVHPWRVALDHWPALVGKLDVGRLWMWEHAGGLLGGDLATAAGVVTLVSPLLVRGRAARAVWAFLAGSFLLRAVVLSLMHNEARFYLSFTPLVLVLASVTVVSVLQMLPRGARVAESLLTLLAVGLAVHSVPKGPWTPRLADPPGVFSAVARQTPAGTLVASDVSWHVAWYSDRPAIRFLGAWPELAGIEDLGVRVGAVLLRGPSGRTFEAEHRRMGGRMFERQPDFRNGYRLWLRRPGTPALVGGVAP